MKLFGVLLLPTFAVTILEAQRDTCTLGNGAQSSVLMQRAKRAPPLPLGHVHPDDAAVPPDDAHRWAERLSAAAIHSVGSRRRRGTTTDDNQGFKVAREQMESVQDGLIAFKASDKDVVDSTMREMKDMQKIVMEIVAALLFANMLAILSVCMCQVYAQNNKAIDEAEKEPVVLGPGARLGMIIEMLAARPGMLARLNGSEVVPVKQADPTLLADAVNQSSPAPIPGALDSALSPANPSPAPQGGTKTGESPRVSAALPKKNTRSNNIVDPVRTVDAFCTPGRRPSDCVRAV